MLLENGADRLTQHRVATYLPSVKNAISAKHNKRGMPVFRVWNMSLGLSRQVVVMDVGFTGVNSTAA